MTTAVKHDELMFEEFDYETDLDIQIREDAEKHMRCYRYWMGQADEINRVCDAEVKRIEAYRERELSEKAMPINDTCGPLFIVSSPSADLQSSLENRLVDRLDVNGSLEYVLTWRQQDLPAGLPI